MDVLGHDCRLRLAGDRPLLTDESNYIIDLHLNRIGKARHLAMLLNQIPGVVENGLFIDICDTVFIGHADGRVMMRDRTGATQAEDRSDLFDLSNIFTYPGD
jgi:ribose 5-phosphate isomerase A